MPRGDKTGPRGEGPKTGRQMGYCTGNDAPGFTYPHSGRMPGFGRRMRWGSGFGPGYGGGPGRGRGPGFRWRYWSQPDQGVPESGQADLEKEIQVLKDAVASLEEQLRKSDTK